MFKDFQTFRNYIENRPKIKKGVGVVLIFIGFIAFVTPLTPGSWLAIIGLELLGLRILFLNKVNSFLSTFKKFINRLYLKNKK